MRTQITNMIPAQVTEFGTKVNNEVTSQLSAARQNLVQTNDTARDTFVDTNRKVVDFAVKTADRIAEQAPTFELPFEVPGADRFEMPTPAEAGKRYIDVVERLAKMNHDFNERVLGMLPVEAPTKRAATKPTAAKPAAARKTATKPAAARKTAKKTVKKVAAKTASAKTTTARKAAAKK